jgi:DNA-binding NtrC family response regulator
VASTLLIDDDDQLRGYLCEQLKALDHTVESLDSAEDGLERVAATRFDVVVLDNKMPRITGLEFLAEIRSRKIEVPVILMTAAPTTASAIRATALGAVKYVVKPVDGRALVTVLNDEIQAILERARESARLPNVRFAPREAPEPPDRPGLVGTSAPMLDVCIRIAECARNRNPVLIHGETGTGKELVARAIHDESPRKSKPFIAVNSGAITATLTESQFFGHRKGSYTGADRDHVGFFERANGGTLFLDEIGDMPADLQVKFLRVLQEGQFERIGGPEIRVDVRVLAATHRDLTKMVREGTFRADLYYRLKGSIIPLPPLRARLEDLSDLVDCFLAQEVATVSRARPEVAEATMEQLRKYHWPGNVRELKNVISDALTRCQGCQLLPLHLKFATEMDPRPDAGTKEDAIAGLKRAIAWAFATGGSEVWDALHKLVGEELVRAALERCGNKTAAAECLGISWNTVSKFLKKDEHKE